MTDINISPFISARKPRGQILNCHVCGGEFKTVQEQSYGKHYGCINKNYESEAVSTVKFCLTCKQVLPK